MLLLFHLSLILSSILVFAIPLFYLFCDLLCRWDLLRINVFLSCQLGFWIWQSLFLAINLIYFYFKYHTYNQYLYPWCSVLHFHCNLFLINSIFPRSCNLNCSLYLQRLSLHCWITLMKYCIVVRKCNCKDLSKSLDNILLISLSSHISERMYGCDRTNEKKNSALDIWAKTFM